MNLLRALNFSPFRRILIKQTNLSVPPCANRGSERGVGLQPTFSLGQSWAGRGSNSVGVWVIFAEIGATKLEQMAAKQDEIRKAMLGLLDPVYKENYLGKAEVLNIFRIPKVGTIAGCRVLDGVLRRDSDIRLTRGGEQIFKGKLGSLKRFKDDAKEVTSGMECGIGINNFNDIQVGDQIEAFVTERMAAELTAQ